MMRLPYVRHCAAYDQSHTSEDLEERRGFEPLEPRGSTVFGTVAISLSAISPSGG